MSKVHSVMARGIRLRRVDHDKSGARAIRVAAALTAATVACTLALATTAEAGVDRGLGYDTNHRGSLSLITRITGAQAMWNAGYAGQGVGVAVIDTGITPVPGLDQPGKVLNGVDLSFDLQDPSAVPFVDGFGHGTHMAGIIAGSDVAPDASSAGCDKCLGTSPYTDSTKFVGIAPEAHIVNVKVGAFDGAADVTQVIAAIRWVVDHRNDPGYNIRVLNLSYGTDTTQSASVDPLARAIEAAWDAGIVVVAAGGNEGKLATTLAMPAVSPVGIAVGSTDSQDSVQVGDDKVSIFAQHGTPDRPVDFATPGTSVISLKVPGSFVDRNTTSGRIGTRFQRGSGTSQSTAIVSGLAALLFSKFPTATPDQIKGFLRANALPYKDTISGKVWFLGQGEASVSKAVLVDELPPATGTPARSTGLGSVESSRGSFHVFVNGQARTGEVDVFDQPWSSDEVSTSWDADAWNGSRWSGSAWQGARWSGARWTGAGWTAGVWDGARWTGARWSDAGWE